MKYVKKNFDKNRFCIDDVLDVVKAKAKMEKKKKKCKKREII